MRTLIFTVRSENFPARAPRVKYRNKESAKSVGYSMVNYTSLEKFRMLQESEGNSLMNFHQT